MGLRVPIFKAGVARSRRAEMDNRFLSAAQTFHQKYAAVTAGLNHLKEVYKREKDARVRLLTSAEKMQ
jgi:hypothetical protein